MVDFVRSQGTEIFFLPEPDATEAMKMSCPTGVTKSGGARTMNELLGLDAEDPEFISGARSATTWSIAFALVPTDTTPHGLCAPEVLVEPVPVLLRLSERPPPPPEPARPLRPPTGRTSFAFQGCGTEVGIDLATNDVVPRTLTVQQSGPMTRTFAS